MRVLTAARISILGLMVSLPICGNALAASEADYKSAYAAAQAAEKEAGTLRNRWLATQAALSDARKAAERGDFDQALAAAREAEALAKASIFQVTSEKEAWKALEIR